MQATNSKSEAEFKLWEEKLMQKINQLRAAHKKNIEALKGDLTRRIEDLQIENQQVKDKEEMSRVSFEALAVEQDGLERANAKLTTERDGLLAERTELISELEQGKTYLDETTIHISYMKGQVERFQEALETAKGQLEPFVRQGLVARARISYFLTSDVAIFGFGCGRFQFRMLPFSVSDLFRRGLPFTSLWGYFWFGAI
jgi:chromosome segregation ATPase